MAASRNSKESRGAANSNSNMPAGDDSKRTRGGSEGAAEPVQPPQQSTTGDSKDASSTAQPLGPPPRPSQQGSSDGDYFSQVHSSSNNSNNNNATNNSNNPHPYQSEPNPFEAQFSNPSSETPGKLPSVAALTSPSALLPGDTPGWNSLRSGPLSPAMLAGPAGNDYFDSGYSRSFPTPNESSLRTGLTPGGGGSMFPAPSPNSQAIFSSLHLGANTPNTMEFLRTSVGAKAAANGIGPTSQPAENQNTANIDLNLPATQNTQVDPFGAHPDADAANGLFMLAQSNGARPGNQFAVPQQPPVMSSNTVQTNNNGNGRERPSRSQRNGPESPGSPGDSSSEEEEQPAKPATRSRGKKTQETKPANNRRKAADTPAKTPANKRQKGNSGQDTKMMESSPMSDEAPTHHKDGRKMTDEEKRKNFLERNRVAALKCRQRKKQWLANLQSKVDLYSQENDALTHTVNQLRDQLMQMKSILVQHKDCPVTVGQGISSQAFTAFLNQDSQLLPYGGPINGVNQGMPMIMADGRQGPSQSQVMSRNG